MGVSQEQPCERYIATTSVVLINNAKALTNDKALQVKEVVLAAPLPPCNPSSSK